MGDLKMLRPPVPPECTPRGAEALRGAEATRSLAYSRPSPWRGSGVTPPPPPSPPRCLRRPADADRPDLLAPEYNATVAGWYKLSSSKQSSAERPSAGQRDATRAAERMVAAPEDPLPTLGPALAGAAPPLARCPVGVTARPRLPWCCRPLELRASEAALAWASCNTARPHWLRGATTGTRRDAAARPRDDERLVAASGAGRMAPLPLRDCGKNKKYHNRR